jgi:hypothetical protein
MRFRFHKSIKLLPHVWLNVGKRGITSVSTGIRGLRLSSGSRGRFISTGIPGSGLSVRERIDGRRGRHRASGRGGSWITVAFMLACLGFAVYLIING